MNPQTWAALQEHGVDESTELRLDFFYVAPGQSEAETLGAFLRRETDYNVGVHRIRKRMLSKKQWYVMGFTQPTTTSLDILNQWVDWMVAAGAEHGGCEFDGWGAEIP
jgi:Regulator of ribonuclease activity B